jgi:hypothetical protein
MSAKQPEMSAAEGWPPNDAPARALATVLRLSGGVLLVAFGAVILPARWMSDAHRWLTMGDFPASPLVDYLTRTISALYGIKGGLYWVLATDVRRYAPLIRYVGWTTIAFGLVVFWVDLRAPLPSYWVMAEGPPIATVGVVLLVLLRRVSSSDSR